MLVSICTLRSKKHIVEAAKTGREAIEKFETSYYDLALLDIKLPDMEGTELLTRMHRAIPKMMKIMITGYPDLENAIESLNRGADAYLTKPIEPIKLLKVVDDKLEDLEEAEKMTEKQLAEWISNRVKKLEQEKLNNRSILKP